MTYKETVSSGTTTISTDVKLIWSNKTALEVQESMFSEANHFYNGNKKYLYTAGDDSCSLEKDIEWDKRQSFYPDIAKEYRNEATTFSGIEYQMYKGRNCTVYSNDIDLIFIDKETGFCWSITSTTGFTLTTFEVDDYKPDVLVHPSDLIMSLDGCKNRHPEAYKPLPDSQIKCK